MELLNNLLVVIAVAVATDWIVSIAWPTPTLFSIPISAMAANALGHGVLIAVWLHDVPRVNSVVMLFSDPGFVDDAFRFVTQCMLVAAILATARFGERVNRRLNQAQSN